MHLLLLLNKKRSLFILILLFTFYFIKVNSNISNSVIISVGNQPITYLDLIKEMRLISILNNIKVDESNRETVKSVAVQGLITRKIKEIEIDKFKIKKFNKADLQGLIRRTIIRVCRENGNYISIVFVRICWIFKVRCCFETKYSCKSINRKF